MKNDRLKWTQQVDQRPSRQSTAKEESDISIASAMVICIVLAFAAANIAWQIFDFLFLGE